MNSRKKSSTVLNYGKTFDIYIHNDNKFIWCYNSLNMLSFIIHIVVFPFC